MQYVVSLAAVALLASACTVKEHTVVEKPVAPAPAAVVYTPAPPTTVVVPTRTPPTTTVVVPTR